MTADRERELRWMLAELQRSYTEAAKPIIDELVDIESRKPPKPFIFSGTFQELFGGKPNK